MDTLTSAHQAPSPEVPYQPEHWNDAYLLQATDVPYVDPDLLTVDQKAAYDTEIQNQYDLVWEQGQALLELAVAKIEGREPGIRVTGQSKSNPEDLERYVVDREQGLGLPKAVLTSNYSIANELYGRMGPLNEMQRSDAILSGLASLILGDIVAPDENPDDKEEERDPYIRSMEKLSGYLDAIEENPDLITEGNEKSLVLAAELLGEALRTPDSVRVKMGLENILGEDVDGLYCRGVVSLCDAVMPRLNVKFHALEDRTSKTAFDRRKRLSVSMERVLLTKYDALFDTIDPEKLEAKDVANKLLGAMVDEINDFSSGLEQGFVYELLVPVVYRYVANSEGRIGTERIWHAPLRADAPLDGLGNKPKKHELDDQRALAVSQHRQQSQDAITGHAGNDRAPFGRTVERWQLKSRTDIANFNSRYDQRMVKIHSSDAIKLFELAAQLNAAFAVDTIDMPEDERIEVLDRTTHDLFCGLIKEIGARVKGEGSIGKQIIVFGVDTEVGVDIPDALDSIVIPDYHELFESTTEKPST